MTESTPAQGADEGAVRDEAPQPDPAGPRWWQRAAPTAVLAVLALTVAALALPEEEIELSTSRKPQPFVELAMTRTAPEVCAGDRARVDFEVTSRLQDAQRLAWTVSTAPLGTTTHAAEERGAVRLRPGAARRVSVRMPTPPLPYDVTVRLKDRPELLRVHCRKERS